MKMYQEYKPLSNKWLGKVPKEWSFTKVKFLGKVVSGSTPDTNISDYWEGEIIWATPIDFGIDSQKYIYSSGRRITQTGLKNIGGRMIPKGSVVISSRAPIGLVAIAGIDLVTNQGCKSIVPKNVNSEYLYYCLKEFSTVLQNLGNETIFAELSLNTFKNFSLPVPPSPEQQSIVRFLDFKTGQIDKFVTNRKKQIELLKEQKVCIINYAITRGLNKNTKLKKSSIKTLDYYPVNWKLTKIKYLLKKKRAAIRTGPFGTQLKNSDLKEDGEIKIYNQRSVINKNFRDGDEYISLEKFEDLKEFVVNHRDFLITTRGTIGKCAIFPENMELGVLHPCLIRMQLDERIILNEYALICLENALYFQEEIKLLSNSTVIEVIYSYNLKEVFLPTPPIKEQEEIISYIKFETSNLDFLIEKFNKQIDLMQEYRKALISQAVTGKIDVRDWKPKTKNYNTEPFPISIAAEN